MGRRCGEMRKEVDVEEWRSFVVGGGEEFCCRRWGGVWCRRWGGAHRLLRRYCPPALIASSPSFHIPSFTLEHLPPPQIVSSL